MSFYIFLPLVAFALCSVLALVVLLRDHRSLVHRTFALFLIFGGLWDFAIFGMRASPDLGHALAWEKAVLITISITAVFLYNFSLAYRNIKLSKVPQLAIYLFPVLVAIFTPTGLVVSGMQLKPYGYAPVPGPLFFPVALGFYLFAILVLNNLVKSYKASTSYDERNRNIHIIIGLSCSLIGGIADVLPLFGLPSYPGAIIGNTIFAILASIAMLRFHLLDIHIVIRKSIAYLLISATVAISYAGIIFLLARVVKTQAIWVYLLLLITLALALQPLWSRIQRLVDRWFYRDRYDYLKTLGTFSQETQSVTDSAKLGSTMVELISKALRSSTVCLLQPLPHSGDFTTAFSTGVNNPAADIRLKRQGALVKWLERFNSMLSYEDIEIIPQLQGITSKEKQILQQVGAELIVPLKATTGQLSGLLILGMKLSEQPYTIEDKQLIYAISSQAAINLENARLYSESQQEVRERKRVDEKLKESHEQLRNLSAHIESLRETERTSIAREIHDELGQALTALKMDLSWLNKTLPREQKALTKKTGEMSRLIDTTIQTVKRISTELRPGVLDDLGLMAAIEWQVQEFQERTRIRSEFTAEGEDINLDRDLATGVFRILQEALTNVARHANATRVKVSLKERAGQLVLEVRDNGKGITEKQIAHPKSFGLIGMRERARSWSGSVKIRGISGKGTIITVSIPLNREEERDDKNTSR